MRFTCNGKEVRRSLRTTDRDLAKRLAFDARREAAIVDPEAGKITLASLCDKYLATVGHQARKTLAQKTYVCDRIKKEWPGGSQVLIRKVLPSQIQTFYQNTVSDRAAITPILAVFRGMFNLAIGDSLLSNSPVAGLKERRREKPIRLTPTWEQFRQIILAFSGDTNVQ